MASPTTGASYINFCLKDLTQICRGSRNWVAFSVRGIIFYVYFEPAVQMHVQGKYLILLLAILFLFKCIQRCHTLNLLTTLNFLDMSRKHFFLHFDMRNGERSIFTAHFCTLVRGPSVVLARKFGQFSFNAKLSATFSAQMCNVCHVHLKCNRRTLLVCVQKLGIHKIGPQFSDSNLCCYQWCATFAGLNLRKNPALSPKAETLLITPFMASLVKISGFCRLLKSKKISLDI